MFDQSFKKLNKKELLLKPFKDAYKTGFRTSNQTNLEKLITIKNKYRIENLYDFAEYKKRIQKNSKIHGYSPSFS